ncbi:MAG TPA: hypothetical protein VJ746_12635 [Nitrospira sp.]|nr:hypothetical protein [Nitrospira sp.]
MAPRNKVIALYGKYTEQLVTYLKEQKHLTSEDQHFIDNHLLIVQLALTTWKHARAKKGSADGAVREVK